MSALPRLPVAGLMMLFCLAAPATGAGQNPAPVYDLVLKNGRIVDGTGSPWFRGDIALRGEVIVRIAPSITEPARRTIDVAGQIVAPGFIDIHTHARRGIFEVPTAENYVRQGVTTLIEGPDGGSPVPLRPFLARLDSLPKSVNIGTFIGQGSIRSVVIRDDANRRATAAEVAQMKTLVEEGMRDGAFGLSSGLFYVPGAFTPTEEVIELARAAGRMGGIYISHMRDEASQVISSVKENIRIGEEGGVPTQATHHKVVGPGNWGQSVETLKLIDQARARGVDATIDQYPYTASATSVQAALLPAWALEGPRSSVLARLDDPAQRAKIRTESARIIQFERGGGDPKNVVFSNCSFDASLAGKNLADVTRLRGLAVNFENAAEAALWIVEQGGCSGIFHAINEDDLRRILKHPATMIASDGEIPIFGQAHPHPRSYGTFARVLGEYVRQQQALTVEEAVRKMSAQPAQRLGLTDRGVLRPGMKADIAVFDPAKVRDAATFEKPHQYAEGFSVVIVNGQVVLENGAMTAARPGRVLYGPAHGGAQRLIDIGGRKLDMMRAGQGSPTVVFDAGLGFTLDTWSNILPRVAELTTAVSYSRAGMGASEPATTPRTLDAIVDDLRALLKSAGLTGPNVLVGHSIGGLYMRYFATKYPAEVAGLVLVDGSHERQAIEFAKLTGAPPPPRPAPDPTLPASREFAGIGPIMTAGSFGLPGKLPDVPMAVLTAARVGTSPQESPERRKVWRDLHADLFQQSSYAIHIVTSKSGHFIHRDEPDLVVDAIRFVVEATRRKR